LLDIIKVYLIKINNRKDHTMKAKDYKSITEILEKKYQCKFYLFMDLRDCENRIKQKRRVK